MRANAYVHRRGLGLFVVVSLIVPVLFLATPARASAIREAHASPSHIVVIAMENEEYGGIIGSPSAPYVNGLARRNVLLTHEYAIRHPSLPNYLALTGGSTFGISSDCTRCHLHARNIIDQLATHQISWKAYMQGMPNACYRGAFAGRAPHDYAKKHNPFMYYEDIATRMSRCRRVVPFADLASDLRHGFPRFAWISPDECFDMHSCPVRTGDRWLRGWVPRILPHLGVHGLLLIVFDEGSTGATCCSVSPGGGRVVTIIAGPGARNGLRIDREVNHYSVLRLIEDAWGLPRLAHASNAHTPSIRGWKAG